MPHYSIYVSCNQCGKEHPMGVGIYLEHGPQNKQSIRNFLGRRFQNGALGPVGRAEALPSQRNG